VPQRRENSGHDERIDAKGRGKTVGERMLADAHGWDADERTCAHLRMRRGRRTRL
jgi:hypothetical protein